MTDNEARAELLLLDTEYSIDNYTRNGTVDFDALLKDKGNAFFCKFGLEPYQGENHLITEYRESIYLGKYAKERENLKVKNYEKEKELYRLSSIKKETQECLSIIFE